MTTRLRYGAAATLAVSVFALYLATLSPSAAMWDAGEYIAAAKSLGIPHQPGNPLYVLIAHVAGLIPLSASYAVRINVLAALSSAVTAGLWFLCAERLLRNTIASDVERALASAVPALFGATAFTVWNQSVVMEKVYPLALVVLALTSWLTLRWIDMPQDRGADKLLILIAYLVGLGYAIHPAGVLTVPAIGTAVIALRPRTILRGKLIALLAAAFLGGTSLFAVLPIRAAYQPYINESAVSACEDGTLRAACTFSAETARRLSGTIRREQYGGHSVTERQAPFPAQLQLFWTYFKWQWMRDAKGEHPFSQSLIAATMLVLGVAGVAGLYARRTQRARTDTDRREAAIFWYFAPLAFLFTIALVYYLNFRYSWNQNPELGNMVTREPRDRDYFYMWTFSLWGMLAGLGLMSFWRGVKTAPLVALAAIPLLLNAPSASRAGQSFTSAWANDMLQSVEPNAVIITNGDNDSFPLWYAQAVEGSRSDVVVALTPYLRMDWYARQLNRRSHLWRLTNEELDTIPPYIETTSPVRFTHGAIDATIPAGVLISDQLLVLRAIKDSFPGRPIYFTAGQYPQQLGLAPYVTQVGLLQKLEPAAVKEGPDTVNLQGGFIDVNRSLALWRQYAGARQVIREGKWVDGASAGIPIYYAAVGQQLAMALEQRGRHAEAQEVATLARQVVEALQ
jgi:hypothetical protein